MNGNKKLVVILLVALFVFMGAPQGVLGADETNIFMDATNNFFTTYSDSGNVSVYAANLVWILMKDEYGRTRKRQYDHSTGKWVTDWILIS